MLQRLSHDKIGLGEQFAKISRWGTGMSVDPWVLDAELHQPGHVPFPMGRPKGAVWHYTDASGLHGIVKSKSLWATSLGMLNDTSEWSHGANLLRETLEVCEAPNESSDCIAWLREVLDTATSESVASRVFVVSTSTSGDLLNQWAHYGGKDGFAVELDPHLPLAKVDEHGKLMKLTGGLPLIEVCFEVLYDFEQQKQAARDMLQWAAAFYSNEVRDKGSAAHGSETLPATLVSTLLAFMKHQAFSDEREARFVVALLPHQRPHFRVSGNRILPYVPLKVRPGSVKQVSGPPLLKAVVLGPNVDARTESVVRQLLQAEGFGAARVSHSEVPFIGGRG